MKAIWKGAISFGLVNIPVNLNTAEEYKELKFSLIDSRDENKIKYKKVNEVTGEEVPKEDVVRAYEFKDGEYVVMDEEDFEKADISAAKTVEIETFINKDELSLMYPERPYYITPDKGAEKPYAILRKAMEKTGKIAIARVVIRTREYLAAVYFVDDALVLNLLRFQEELRSMEDLNIPKSVPITDKELELAVNLVDSMTEKWEPEKFKDKYKESVMKRIEMKSRKKGKFVEEEAPEPEKPTGKVVNILDLLKKSVEAKNSEKKTGSG